MAEFAKALAAAEELLEAPPYSSDPTVAIGRAIEFIETRDDLVAFLDTMANYCRRRPGDFENRNLPAYFGGLASAFASSSFSENDAKSYSALASALFGGLFLE